MTQESMTQGSVTQGYMTYIFYHRIRLGVFLGRVGVGGLFVLHIKSTRFCPQVLPDFLGVNEVSMAPLALLKLI